MNDNTPKRLKRVVIKEEFVALTGDFIKAILLNQFIYWSERVNDFDSFIAEEKRRAEQNGVELNLDPTNGWIYKSSEELAEETMLKLSASNMRKHIKDLVEKGWLSERTNPSHKWDRTKQYRVNIINIRNDLLKLDYVIQDYKIELPFSKIENAFSKTENAFSQEEDPFSKTENGSSKTENRTSRNRKAIPEITTEITTEVDPSINQSSKEIHVSKARGWTDGVMDEITNSDNKDALLAYLQENTGATDEQIRLAIARTMELKAAGKVKSNLLELLLKVVETVMTEDVLKQLVDDKACDESKKSKSEKKEFIKSLYLS